MLQYDEDNYSNELFKKLQRLKNGYIHLCCKHSIPFLLSRIHACNMYIIVAYKY